MNDAVVLRDRPALVPILVIWPLAALVLGGPFLVIALVARGPILQLIPAAIGLLFIATSAYRLVVDLVDAKTTLYTLTARHVFKEYGILRRDQKVIPLDNVQMVTVKQPLVGRWLDYGTVVVEAAGLGVVRLRMVPKPHLWQQTILQSIPPRQPPPTAKR